MTQVPPTIPTVPPTAYRPHRGTLILTFGILGLVLCVVFGIVAWVMGNTDLQEMAAGRMDPTGEGITRAGKICGMVATILTLAGMAIAVVMLVIMLLIGVASAAA